MTRDVYVTTRGMQFTINEATGESEDIEIITSGQYFERNGKGFLMYDEIMEGVEQPVNNTVKFDAHGIEVTKKGMINVHMVFEEGKKNMSDYHTPFGNLIIGIDTKKVSINETEDRIHIEAEYGMDINYEFLSECRISMDITPKDELQL